MGTMVVVMVTSATAILAHAIDTKMATKLVKGKNLVMEKPLGVTGG